MTKSFKRSATATFAINGTDQEVTVANVPYIWVPATNPDMDSEGSFAVMDWMRANNVAKNMGKSLICVTTSPA
jgi:hypothetical protein